MTVTVDRRKIGVSVLGPIAITVMDLDEAFRLEEESARLTAPLLFLQQGRESPRHAGVFALPRRPITPASIIQAGLPLHFDVSHNWHVRVLVEAWSVFLPEVPALAWRDVPVATDHPPPTFARMPEEHPPSELLVQSMVEQMKGLCTDHGAVVVGPAGDDRVEQADEIALSCRFVPADELRQLRPVAFHCLCTGRDERLEAPSPRRVVLARPVLANLEAEEVEAGLAPFLFERVGDAGLRLAQLQSDAFKPCLRQLTTVLDHGAVPVEDDQIIGVPDDLGLPMELTARLFRIPSRPDRELSTEVLFESVQGDVGQQRRQHASLRRSSLRCDKHIVIEDAGLEPGFDQSVQGRGCLQLTQEGCLVDAVETLGDIS